MKLECAIHLSATPGVAPQVRRCNCDHWAACWGGHCRRRPRCDLHRNRRFSWGCWVSSQELDGFMKRKMMLLGCHEVVEATMHVSWRFGNAFNPWWLLVPTSWPTLTCFDWKSIAVRANSYRWLVHYLYTSYIVCWAYNCYIQIYNIYTNPYVCWAVLADSLHIIFIELFGAAHCEPKRWYQQHGRFPGFSSRFHRPRKAWIPEAEPGRKGWLCRCACYPRLSPKIHRWIHWSLMIAPEALSNVIILPKVIYHWWLRFAEITRHTLWPCSDKVI